MHVWTQGDLSFKAAQGVAQGEEESNRRQIALNDADIQRAMHSVELANLITQTMIVVIEMSNSDDVVHLPTIGGIYKNRARAPGRIRVAAVVPNYNEFQTAICVLYSDINPEAHQSVSMQIPNHLRVEPLCWFNDNYEPEDAQGGSAPRHPKD
jgi:hypothetical protein